MTKDELHGLLARVPIKEAEGTIDLAGNRKVRVGLAYMPAGFEPGWGAIFVADYGSDEGAMQAAAEMLEEHILNRMSKADIDELESEHGESWMGVLFEDMQALGVTLTAVDAADVIAGTQAEKLIEVWDSSE